MNQIKEKAPVTPASATSANSQHKVDQYHNEDTTDTGKKQGLTVSNYLKFCAAMKKDPMEDVVWVLHQEIKPCQNEEEPEFIHTMEGLSPEKRTAIWEIIYFLHWMKHQGKAI